MSLSPLAGKPAPQNILVNVENLIQRYFEATPNLEDPYQLVSFGTSGHRGSPLRNTYTEAHVLAITQAICDYRVKNKITGPIFLGKDTHALSAPSEKTALEVLAANQMQVILQKDSGKNFGSDFRVDLPYDGGFAPTPVISRAILAYNRGRRENFADGIIITPSHNPPEEGGFKYNPPNGGPADSAMTTWIQNRANELLKNKNGLTSRFDSHQGNISRDPALSSTIHRMSYAKALTAPTTHTQNLMTPYLEDLKNVIDMDCIRNSGLKIGVDPLGGAATHYWEPMKAMYGLDLTVVNPKIDPTFSFMSVDHDGKIRMDCSSPYAMASLIGLKNQYQLAFGNDADCDRHGIVTPTEGLMNPNHFLAVAIQYLLGNRPAWNTSAAVGKTLVSSSMIDLVVKKLGRRLSEVPVGFKWFAPGLFDGSICFGGEESAGASFLRRDGTVWTTDKDGMILDLLAAEITARTGRNPSEHYQELTREFGAPVYTRIDTPATPEEKTKLQKLSPENVRADSLAGEKITAKLTRAPGNDAPIGGLKIVTENGWFAARPSGTENVYKIYAESFKGDTHLNAIVEEAKVIVNQALKT